MKAIQYTAYNGIDGMRLVDTTVPVPAANEVLVKVHAAGVNPVDIAVSHGVLKEMMPLAFPITAGSELAGTIKSLGDAVTGFQVGDEVHAVTGIAGAFAEYCIVKAEALVAKPQNMSFSEAAGLPIAAATATAALNAANVESDVKILIHAASGSVGSVAVQIAKVRGAYVIALGSKANLDFLESLGADQVIDRNSDYENRLNDIDVVFDAYGTEAQQRSWGVLKKGGLMLSIVAEPSKEKANAYGVRACRVNGTPTAKVLAAADALVTQGKLNVCINKTYPLEKAIAALNEQSTGTVRGKLALEMLPQNINAPH